MHYILLELFEININQFRGEKTMRWITTLLLLLFICSSCDLDLVKETETETFTVEHDFEILYVETKAGKIDINNSGSTDGGVDVLVEKFAYGLTDFEARNDLDKITIKTELDGNTYKIIVESPYDDMRPDLSFNGGANLTLNNVNGKQVKLITFAGVIDCEEIPGGDIKTAAGLVTVEKSEGTLTVEAAAGEIDVKEFWGDQFTLKSTAGSIDINVMGSGPIDGSISATAGSISLDLSEDRSCKVEVSTDVGDININGVDDFDEDNNFPGISGNASFELNDAEGEIFVETTVGEIDVNVK